MAMRNPFRTLFANDYLWRDDFVDVASLNTAASDLIGEHVERVRVACAKGDVEQLGSSCILLVGPAGAGKTHLFARLRRALGRRAVFVLIRPDISAQANLRHVLANTVDALSRRPGSSGRRQFDIVVGALLAAAKGGNVGLPLSYLNKLLQSGDGLSEELREDAIELVEERGDDIHPMYLERLVQLPFAKRREQRALLAWLSGREPSQPEMRRIGARSALDDTEILRSLRTLGVAAGIGAPLVLVFDQLENLLEDDEVAGRIHAYARMVSELRDSVSGMVIVQMALDSEWERRIRPALNPAERDRLEQHRLTLALPTSDQRRELIRLWLDRVPEQDREGPFPWPFAAEQVDQWATTPGMTPRMVLQSCGEALEHGCEVRGAPESTATTVADSTTTSPNDRLAGLWEQQLERAREEVDEASEASRGVDGSRILSALERGLRLTGLAQLVSGSPPNDKAPSMRVAREDERCEVVVLQHRRHQLVGAVLRRVSARRCPTVLLREAAWPIPPTWEATNNQLDELLANGNTQLVLVERAEIVRVLAMYDLLAAARSQDLSDDSGGAIPYEAVVHWVKETLGVRDWELLRVASGTGIAGPSAASQDSAVQPSGAEGPGVSPPADPLPASSSRSASPSAAAPRSRTASPKRRSPAASSSQPAASDAAPEAAIVAVDLLEELRVASVGKLLREARASRPDVTRGSVIAALRSAGVSWLGDSIVAAARERRP